MAAFLVRDQKEGMTSSFTDLMSILHDVSVHLVTKGWSQRKTTIKGLRLWLVCPGVLRIVTSARDDHFIALEVEVGDFESQKLTMANPEKQQEPDDQLISALNLRLEGVFFGPKLNKSKELLLDTFV